MIFKYLHNILSLEVSSINSLHSPCPPEPGPPLQATLDQLSDSPSPLCHSQTPDFSFESVPDSEDPASLWARVMATRVHIQVDEDEPERSEISAATGFVSQTDSDASTQPEEPQKGQYNQATYGILPGELLR
jgi:hypothetical protein